MIKVLTKEKLADLHTAVQPFDIIGKLDITYKDGKWHSEEKLFENTSEKQYPSYDGAKPCDYINGNDRIAFLDRCVLASGLLEVSYADIYIYR